MLLDLCLQHEAIPYETQLYTDTGLDHEKTMNAVYKMQGTADTYGIDDKAYHGSIADCGKPCLSYESAYSQHICDTIKDCSRFANRSGSANRINFFETLPVVKSCSSFIGLFPFFFTGKIQKAADKTLPAAEIAYILNL